MLVKITNRLRKIVDGIVASVTVAVGVCRVLDCVYQTFDDWIGSRDIRITDTEANDINASCLCCLHFLAYIHEKIGWKFL